MAWTGGLVVCTLLVLFTQCIGQGLAPDKSATLGASSAQDRLDAVYKHSKVWAKSYRNSVTVCSKSSGSLCAAALNNDQQAQLLMATSPQTFDARTPSDMGGFSAVGPVKNQGDCTTCVSFTILAAAQSAMACALKKDATGSLSEQDFFFCKSVGLGEQRTCSNSWNMQEGVNAWVKCVDARKYPVTEYCMQYNPQQIDCTNSGYNCQDTNSDLDKGHFLYLKMNNIWEVQEHIRNWGAVVTRLDVYDDFKSFFKTNPGGIYPGPSSSAKFYQSHAITLVGYDMDSTPQYWIAKNSWGTGFASGGYFKIAMGVDKSGVCSPGDTFGLMFMLYKPLPPSGFDRLSDSTRPGCKNYRASPSDYVSRIAYNFKLSIQQILLDNKDNVPEPDMRLSGITLLLCGIKGVPDAPAAAQPAAPPPIPPPAPPPKHSTGQLQQQKPQQQQQKPQHAQKQQADTSGGDSSSGQDQQQSYTLYYLIIGTYKGSVKCDDKQGTATAALQRDDTRNVGQVLMTSTYVLNGQCTYKMILACNSVRDGTGTWCTGDEEPWLCVVEQTPQWDPCGGQAPQKASSLQMCYSSNSLLLKSLSPTCNSESGTLSLQ